MCSTYSALSSTIEPVLTLFPFLSPLLPPEEAAIFDSVDSLTR